MKLAARLIACFGCGFGLAGCYSAGQWLLALAFGCIWLAVIADLGDA